MSKYQQLTQGLYGPAEAELPIATSVTPTEIAAPMQSVQSPMETQQPILGPDAIPNPDADITGYKRQPLEPVVGEPSFAETSDAMQVVSWRENIARRAGYALTDLFAEAPTDYKATDDPAMGMAEPKDIPGLSNSKSHEILIRGISDRRKQRQAKEVLAKSGFVANVLAGITNDPELLFLPGGAAIKEAGLAKTIGQAALQSFKAGAKVAIPQAIAVEGSLYGLLETQTLEETAINIAAQSVVGTLTGGLVGTAFSLPAKDYVRSVKASMKGLTHRFKVNKEGVVESVSVYNETPAGAEYKGDIVNLQESYPRIEQIESLKKIGEIESTDEFLAAMDANWQAFQQATEKRMAGLMDVFVPEMAGVVDQPKPGSLNMGASSSLSAAQSPPLNGRTLQGEKMAQGPFNIAKPFIWLGQNVSRNPVMIGLSGKSQWLVKFTNDSLRHHMITNDMLEKGLIPGRSLQEIIEIKSKTDTFNMQADIRKGYMKYLGIEPTETDYKTIAGVKIRLKQKQLKGMGSSPLTEKQFTDRVQRAMVSGEDAMPEVLQEANRLNEKWNKPLSEALKTEGYSLPDSPYGAVNHLSRIYDQEGIIGDMSQKIAKMQEWFTETNTKIQTVMSPLTDIQRKKYDAEAIGDLAAFAQHKKQATAFQKQVEDNVLKSVRPKPGMQAPYSQDMLVGESAMNYWEIEQLNALRKPIFEIKKEIALKKREIKGFGTQAGIKVVQDADVMGLADRYIESGLQKVEKVGLTRATRELEALQVEAKTAYAEKRVELDEAIALAKTTRKELAQYFKARKAFEKTRGVLNATRLEEQSVDQKFSAKLLRLYKESKLLADDLSARQDALRSVKEAFKDSTNLPTEKAEIARLGREIISANNKIQRETIGKKVKAGKAELAKLSLKLKEERAKVNQGVQNGTIPESLVFYAKSTGEYRLRKPNKGNIRLGEVLDNSELYHAAYKTIENITGLSPEAMANDTRKWMKSNSSGPSLTGPRVLKVSDKELIDAGMLRMDLASNLSAKIWRTNRMVAMGKYFKQAGWDGVEGYKEFGLRKISEDYAPEIKKLEQQFDQKIGRARTDKSKAKLLKQKKIALNKLSAEQKLAGKAYQTFIDRLSGVHETKDGLVLKSVRVMKDWAYATQLLANVIPGLNDAVSGIYVHGGYDVLRHGYANFLQDLALLHKGGGARLRNQLRDFHIGVETEMAIRGPAAGDTILDTLPLGRVAGALSWAARAGQVLGLASISTDFFRRINARVTLATLTRDLKYWQKNGKLSKKALKKWQVMRFDPNATLSSGQKVGHAVLEQFDKYGEKVGGSYLPNKHLWDNVEAVEQLNNLVNRENEAMIFAGNDIASYPLEIDPHGLGSSFLMYMGYMFQATEKYTIPLLQDPKNAPKVMGALALIFVGMLQEPIRRIVNGKEAYEDGESFVSPQSITKGVLNSGIAGAPGEMFSRLNAAFDLVPSVNLEKTAHHRTLAEQLAPSYLGLIQNTGEITGALINNEWNKTDAKKVDKVFPLLRLWEVRQPLNNYVESLDLPRTRQKARALKGE